MYALRRCTTPLCKRAGPSVSSLVSLGSFRSIHHVRPLPFDIEYGLGDFMSPAALKTVAVDYQKGLLDRLNEEVKGTDLEGLSVAQTIVNTAPRTENTLVFNYASQALNNSFFFDNLLPPGESPSEMGTPDATSHEHTMSSNLRATINQSFGSLDQLKSTMSAAALGMMSSGWIWLVCDETGRYLAIVPSFGPGTMLVRSRQHRHPEGLAADIGFGFRLGQSPFSVLGEAISTEKTHTGSTSPTRKGDRFGPQSPPVSRAFHSSTLNNSPLYTTALAYNTLSSRPRFSQASLPWTELEPLSKSNGSPRAMTIQNYSTERSGGGNSAFAGDDLEDPFGSLPEPVERPLDSSGSRATRSVLNSFAKSSSWNSDRLRGQQDDMCPLMCISVHEHMWMAAGY
ncbi:hypothetical protein FRC20_000722, partial [Serendipita sp. 405]